MERWGEEHKERGLKEERNKREEIQKRGHERGLERDLEGDLEGKVKDRLHKAEGRGEKHKVEGLEEV